MYSVSNEIERICGLVGLSYKFATLAEAADSFTHQRASEWTAGSVYPAMVVLATIDQNTTKDRRHKFKFNLNGYVIADTLKDYTTNEALNETIKDIQVIFDSFLVEFKKSSIITTYYDLKLKTINHYLNSKPKLFNEPVDIIEFEIEDCYCHRQFTNIGL